jgi:hypothetical protein
MTPMVWAMARTRAATPTERDERGVATVLAVPVATAVTAVCLLGAAHLGGAALDRARADAVADLSALAAVTGGDVDAVRVATANGGRVIGVRHGSGVRTVTVVVSGVAAVAAAAPADPGGG